MPKMQLNRLISFNDLLITKHIFWFGDSKTRPGLASRPSETFMYFFSCGLSTATIEYSSPSVCPSFCVYICVSVYTITQKIMVQST